MGHRATFNSYTNLNFYDFYVRGLIKLCGIQDYYQIMGYQYLPDNHAFLVQVVNLTTI